MQVPSSSQGISPVALIALIILAVLLLASVRKRRENFRHNLWVLSRAAIIGGAVFLLTSAVGWTQDKVWLAALAAAVVSFLAAPRRSRYAPASTRRRVIARWEADTGKKFNSRYWEVDHIIPFSQGGSNTEDNLEVVAKSRNRSKGSKSPRWDILRRR